MSPQFVLAGTFLLQGILLAGVSLPLVAGRVKRNGVYGFRTPKTLSSDDVWYAANRYAGRQLFGAGSAQIAGTLLLLPFAGRLDAGTLGLLGLALTLVPLGVALAKSFRYLGRL